MLQLVNVFLLYFIPLSLCLPTVTEESQDTTLIERQEPNRSPQCLQNAPSGALHFVVPLKPTLLAGVSPLTTSIIVIHL